MNLQLEFIKPKVATGKAKCTIQKTGKLGFSSQAQKLLKINDESYAKIALNKEGNRKNLYLVMLKEKDEYAFKFSKAGGSYYINTKQIFDDMKLDYKNKKIIYDIEKVDTTEMEVYELNRRELDRKNS